VDIIFDSIYARAFLGAGLSALTGVRAFLPIAFLALYSRLEFASAPVLDQTWFGWLQQTWVIVLLFVLAVIELVAEKFPALGSTNRQILRPVKIVLGGLIFSAVMAPDGWIAMLVCGILGLAVAGLTEIAANSLRPRPEMETTPFVLLSIYADLVVLIGTLLFVLVPLIGALFACFMFLFVYRVQQRRKRKYKGMRILK
jgi:uncharacterized membrane protein